jgi:hypothetical protein
VSESPQDRLSKLISDRLRQSPDLLASMRNTLDEAEARNEISDTEATHYRTQIERIEREAEGTS